MTRSQTTENMGAFKYVFHLPPLGTCMSMSISSTCMPATICGAGLLYMAQSSHAKMPVRAAPCDSRRAGSTVHGAKTAKQNMEPPPGGPWGHSSESTAAAVAAGTTGPSTEGIALSKLPVQVAVLVVDVVDVVSVNVLVEVVLLVVVRVVVVVVLVEVVMVVLVRVPVVVVRVVVVELVRVLVVLEVEVVTRQCAETKPKLWPPIPSVSSNPGSDVA
mmetsp:Transcript_20509/g.54861  ORF Transcript_20509/g.54861 Transcript_20509/m.54861 type:complete len:217 (+) Transcript_20509:520-1170(+)